MSITIKVLLADKMYKLTPNATTLALVDSEMKQRFPKLSSLQYFYGEQPIHDLRNIIELLRRQGQTSLKLTAKEEI